MSWMQRSHPTYQLPFSLFYSSPSSTFRFFPNKDTYSIILTVPCLVGTYSPRLSLLNFIADLRSTLAIYACCSIKQSSSILCCHIFDLLNCFDFHHSHSSILRKPSAQNLRRQNPYIEPFLMSGTLSSNKFKWAVTLMEPVTGPVIHCDLLVLFNITNCHLQQQSIKSEEILLTQRT
jgi:hypothetical protein